VGSMQIEHQQVTSVKKGDSVGIKVAEGPGRGRRLPGALSIFSRGREQWSTGSIVA